MLFATLFFALLFSIAAPQPRPGSDNGGLAITPSDVCLSEYESALFVELNAYRAKHKLPPVALSRSLTLVAQLHARDLALNEPHRRSQCNMHSWSSKGPWTACCYTRDHRRSDCMWNKPRELTVYQGDGFEIAFHSTATYPGAQAFARDAIQSWSESRGHNEVILNRGTWRKIEWKAMGIGYYQGYAMVWFGMPDDPDSSYVDTCP